MKAIRTWYVGPGNVRGSRICATDGDGCKVSLEIDPAWSTDQMHIEAARALCEKRNWHGELVEGYLMKGGNSWFRVWVWIDFGDHNLKPLLIKV